MYSCVFVCVQSQNIIFSVMGSFTFLYLTIFEFLIICGLSLRRAHWYFDCTMMNMNDRYRLLLLRLIMVCMVSTATMSARTVTATTTSTPIPNFESSWTASSVGGTTIAIPFTLNNIEGSKQNHDVACGAVVMIFRSSLPLAFSSTTNGVMMRRKSERVKSAFAPGGVNIVGPIYTTSDDLPLSQASQRWTLLGSTAICSMTGFAPDIDYLTRYLQSLVDRHRTTYESTSASKTTLISPMSLVEALAEELQEAGQWQGGRPFGIQALIVGRDTVREPTSSLGIFTLDPSGGYRRWRGGAAIGRNGKTIRDLLLEYWMSPKNMKECNDDGVEALFSGLQASVLARMGESEQLESSDTYEAVLIWQSKKDFCVAQVDRAQIDEMRESILNKHKEKSM